MLCNIELDPNSITAVELHSALNYGTSHFQKVVTPIRTVNVKANGLLEVSCDLLWHSEDTAVSLHGSSTLIVIMFAGLVNGEPNFRAKAASVETVHRGLALRYWMQ